MKLASHVAAISAAIIPVFGAVLVIGTFVSWPATGAVTAARPICLYPQTAAYKGERPDGIGLELRLPILFREEEIIGRIGSPSQDRWLSRIQ